MSRLTSFFAKSPPPRILNLESFAGTTYVIGDIHGCLDLLQGLERKIQADAKGQGGPSLLICVGDMVDRGPSSYGVLAHVMAPPPKGFERICLMGNHEEMMLDFLDAPTSAAPWLVHGGLETLMSYGALESEIRLAASKPRSMKYLLNRIIPDPHTAFLRSLSHAVLLKDFVISHAGGHPARPANQQTVQDYIWGAGGPSKARPDGQKDFVHGHYVVEKAEHSGGKVAIDTGAYARGELTAAKLGPDKAVEFISFSRV